MTSSSVGDGVRLGVVALSVWRGGGLRGFSGMGVGSLGILVGETGGGGGGAMGDVFAGGGGGGGVLETVLG